MATIELQHVEKKFGDALASAFGEFEFFPIRAAVARPQNIRGHIRAEIVNVALA